MTLTHQLICDNKDKLKEFRFIIIQHLMSDTYKFLNELIDSGIEIHQLFVKEYSCDESYYKKLQNVVPIKIINGKMTQYYNVTLENAILKSKYDNKRIAILDLGGEYSSILSNIKSEKVQIVVVEDTAFGHRKYEQTLIKNESIQLFSVAKSEFKEIEAKFVGKSIVDSAEYIFRSFGQTISGKNVLVIGYGMIGKNVAEQLKKMNCKVSIYDKDAIKMCRAYFDGYNVEELAELLKVNAIIFGTTGHTSIDYSHFQYLLNHAVLISGSSKQIEFSKQIINNLASVDKYVDKCTIKNKELFLLNKGYPINFISKSVPDCIINFMFAEMIMCLVQAFNNNTKDGENIKTLSVDGMNMIARLFLNNSWKACGIE